MACPAIRYGACRGPWKVMPRPPVAGRYIYWEDQVAADGPCHDRRRGERQVEDLQEDQSSLRDFRGWGVLPLVDLHGRGRIPGRPSVISWCRKGHGHDTPR